MYIHVNIFKIYAVCVSLYIHNKYTQYTHRDTFITFVNIFCLIHIDIYFYSSITEVLVNYHYMKYEWAWVGGGVWFVIYSLTDKDGLRVAGLHLSACDLHWLRCSVYGFKTGHKQQIAPL